MILGNLFFMPIPGNENEHICQADLPERNSSIFRYMEPISHYSLRATGENDTNIEVEDGCCSLDWCKDQPAMNVVQFVIAFFIVAAGHPFRVSLSQSLFIKVLGPIPQVSYHVINKIASQQYYFNEAMTSLNILISFPNNRELGSEYFKHPEVLQDV